MIARDTAPSRSRLVQQFRLPYRFGRRLVDELSWWTMRAVPAGLLLAMMGTVWSCAPARPANPLQHDDPSVKIPAMKQAARAHDLSAAPQLVKDLENDDPAIRMYAIEALRQLTGQDMEYHYYDDEAARAPAIERWRQWLKAKNGV